VNIAARSLVLYGVVGGRISLQVFSKPQPPCAGLLAALA
jgi:hypothetical protein